MKVNIFDTDKKYNIIYADPPWEYKESGGGKKGTAGMSYETMPTKEICTRVGKQYKHEMTDSDHEELLRTLLQSKAKIMISGYESEMYNDYLSNWEKRQFKSCAEHGKPRNETIWMNYEQEAQLSLFDAKVML